MVFWTDRVIEKKGAEPQQYQSDLPVELWDVVKVTKLTLL